MEGLADYKENLKKEADFWGKMAEERQKGGIPLTMDFQLGTRYRVKREAVGWGDYIQDPKLEALTPFGMARKKIIEFAKKFEGENALDLCCGAGFLSLELARAGKNVDAIDCSEREINVAKEYQSTLKEKPKGRIYWMVADLNHCNLPREKYDVITAWDGLHHIVNIEGLCQKIQNALKPEGVFIFSERVWGGKNQSLKTRICQGLEITTNVCLPLAWSHKKRREEFKRMLKIIYYNYILRKNINVENSENNGYVSPFEDATGREMLEAIGRSFKIKKLQRFGAFTEEACRSLKLPRPLRFPSILFLAWFDYLWVKTGLLEGKLMLGYASKKYDFSQPLNFVK
jgi:2-polyprenyl-3-methyl-5-hydroxy-6-metoxy-1,4-benzoquinol methylase